MTRCTRAPASSMSIREYHHRLRFGRTLAPSAGSMQSLQLTRLTNSGGEEVLMDVAGQDATDSFEDVGHSDEAREILEGLLVGKLKRTVCLLPTYSQSRRSVYILTFLSRHRLPTPSPSSRRPPRESPEPRPPTPERTCSHISRPELWLTLRKQRSLRVLLPRCRRGVRSIQIHAVDSSSSFSPSISKQRIFSVLKTSFRCSFSFNFFCRLVLFGQHVFSCLFPWFACQNQDIHPRATYHRI
jgi:hypothetical protein